MAEKYLDREHNIIYTKNDLLAEYETMKKNGELEEYDNFGQYLNACLDKNGILERI